MLALIVLWAGVGKAYAEDAKKPAPDVIQFKNGDQLTGKLLRENDGTVTFHSDIAGDISVGWDKIQSIHSAQQFAVVRKGQQVTLATSSADVPQGPVSVSNQQVTVTAQNGAKKEMPIKTAEYIIDEKTFQTEVIHKPGFFYGWNGSVTLGATLVQATQTSQSYTGALTLARVIPTVDWLAPRNRTTLNASAAYGLVSQPFIAGVQDASVAKTSIYHGDLERDRYLSPRFYYLFDASADHNLGSGLELQHIYGVGLGWTVIKNTQQELDFKGDIHYEQQQFYAGTFSPLGTPNVNLIGANVNENYTLKLPRAVVFTESATIQPAFNVPRAYSAFLTTGFNFPVYKRLSFTTNSQDNFLNDPPAGYRKNTYQFTAGATYTLK